jgi:hypothetical protein
MHYKLGAAPDANPAVIAAAAFESPLLKYARSAWALRSDLGIAPYVRAGAALLTSNAQAFLFQRLTQPDPVLAHSSNRGPQCDCGSLLLRSDENPE